ncbi:MAG: hypothetical protein ABIA63_07845, partial [bacterium]
SKIRFYLSMFIFLLMMLIGIGTADAPDWMDLAMITLKACTGYVIFWLLSLVVVDVVFKTMIFEVKEKHLDKWQQGMLARFVEKSTSEKSEHNIFKNNG